MSQRFKEKKRRKRWIGKIILDLCGGTGAWSEPYKRAGFTVYHITLQFYNITKCGINGKFIVFYNQNMEADLYIEMSKIYGILAAPPCPAFSFAAHGLKLRKLKEGMEVVNACLQIIWNIQYFDVRKDAKKTTLKFWAL